MDRQIVFYICITWCLFQLSKCQEMPETGSPKLVPARVISVKEGVKNQYFSVIPDKTSPTNWTVKPDYIYDRWQLDGLIRVYMFDNSTPDANSSHPFFIGFFCSLRVNDSRYDVYPKENFLPAQIVNMIFPQYTDTCDFYTSDRYKIQASGEVNVNPYDNPSVMFPDTDYYKLSVNFILPEYSSQREDKYMFQVNYLIGNPPSSEPETPKNGPTSKYQCLGTYWNYWVIWRTCTIYEFTRSIVTGVGHTLTALIP